METIKPEKDEVDAYQRLRAGAAKANGKPSERGAAQPALMPEGGRTDAPEPPRPVAKGAARTGRWMVPVLCVLVVVMAGTGAWQVHRQTETIAIMEAQLDSAQRTIEQSQLVVARLEGQLTRTDATMAQSGNELALEMKRMDVELRKLARDQAAQQELLMRRLDEQSGAIRKSVETLQGELGALGQQARALDARGDQLGGRIDEIVARETDLANRLETQVALATVLSDRLSEQERQVLTLTEASQARQAALLTLEARLDPIEASLGSLGQRVAALGGEVDLLREAQPGTVAAAGQIQALEQRMEAIDATRSQLVQRFVGLDRKLNEIGLELQALRAQSPTR